MDEAVIYLDVVERDDGGATVLSLGEDGLGVVAEYTHEQLLELAEDDE